MRLYSRDFALRTTLAAAGLILGLLALSLTGGSRPLTGDLASAQASGSPAYRVGVVAGGLELPWGLAFHPDGSALVTERDSGRLLKVKPSGKIRRIRIVPEKGTGEGGLLGISLHPKFENNRFVYVYYSTQTDNRVARFRLGGERDKLEPILTGIPVNSNHNGGRIAFGPDGMLYVATGDAGDTSRSQNKRSLGGKILRVKPGGGIPQDNPFRSCVWSLGHRNVQGLAWDRQGRMYATEFGQNTYDEINRIKKGANYGWPVVEGRENDPRYSNPIVVFRPENASPSGAAVYKSTAIPGWNGDLFAAALRGERLWRIELDERGGATDKSPLLQGDYGRLRHVAPAPGGSLWLLTSNGADDRVLRILPNRR